MKAFLIGGPFDGQQREVGDHVTEIRIPYLGSDLSAFIAVELPSRPPWWQPLALRRWKRTPLPVPEPPPFAELSYRLDGQFRHQLAEGVRIYRLWSP